MLKIQWILGPALFLGPAVAQSFAQKSGDSPFRTNTQRARSLNQAPQFMAKSNNRHPLSTFDTSRNAGIVTLPDQARSILPRNFRFSRYDMQPLPTTAIKRHLDQQNLLGVRSPLARKTTSTNGRNDFVTDDETGQMFGDYSRIEKLAASGKSAANPQKADDGSFQDAIIRRLEAKANEYYDLGASAFRQGKYIQANGYFDLVKDVENDKTRPYLAKVIVGVQKDDYLSAHANLLRAIDITPNLDGLKVDVTKFYKGPEDFRRRVELMNLKASRTTDNPIAGLLQSYYMWLNGDLGTAIAAATAAEKNSPGDAGRAVKKFRDLMIVQRTAPKPTADSAAPATPQSTSQKSL